MSYPDMATYRADHEEPDEPLVGEWYDEWAGPNDELPIAPACPACFGLEATVLGMLGQRLHLRCRDCGMDRSYLLPF